MPLLHSLILGLVEGFSEFLPISSTAHLILASKLLGLEQSSFVKTFEIAIQSGAIAAVLVIYWRRFLDLQILKKIIVAFVPTAFIGLALYKFAKEYLLGNISVVLWALGIGGALLIIFEIVFSKSNSATNFTEPDKEIGALGYGKAVLIGIAQALAIIPGVSRSAATIIGGSLVGMSRVAVVEFSFLLAVPTILSATGLDLVKNIHAFTSDQIGSLAVGFIAAFITAIFGIKFLLKFVKNKSFIGFGVYRIVLVILFILFFI